MKKIFLAFIIIIYTLLVTMIIIINKPNSNKTESLTQIKLQIGSTKLIKLCDISILEKDNPTCHSNYITLENEIIKEKIIDTIKNEEPYTGAIAPLGYARPCKMDFYDNNNKLITSFIWNGYLEKDLNNITNIFNTNQDVRLYIDKLLNVTDGDESSYIN